MKIILNLLNIASFIFYIEKHLIITGRITVKAAVPALFSGLTPVPHSQ